MPRLHWKDMDSSGGHLSPVDSPLLTRMSHWMRLSELNLNCRLKPTPTQIPNDSGTRWENQTASQVSLCRPFAFHCHHLTTRASTGNTLREAHTCIQSQMSKWKQEESVTHTTGLRVDYRTPEEIFLSPSNCQWKGIDHSWAPKQTHSCCSIWKHRGETNEL